MAKATLKLGRLTILLKCAAYFLDANLLLAAHVSSHPHHKAASLLLSQLLVYRERNRLGIWLSPLVVDEVWWNLLRMLYDSENGKGAWADLCKRAASREKSEREQAKGKRAEAVRRHVGELKRFTNFILSKDRFDMAGLGSEEIRHSLARIDDHQLMPHDAFHCSVMARQDATGIVSNDRDFDFIPGVGQRIAFDFALQ